MNTKKKVSIKGSIVKCGSSWTANFPSIKVSSRGSSPSECIDALKGMIQLLTGEITFEFNIEISDKGLLVLSSTEKSIFLAFVKSRIMLSHDQETFLAELNAEY